MSKISSEIRKIIQGNNSSREKESLINLLISNNRLTA